MSVRVRLTGTRLDAVPLTNEALMRQIGQTAIVRIQRRTQEQGIDANGRPFRSYSARYALQKEHGIGTVFGHHGGTGKVDLTVTGRMLDAMYCKNVTAKSVTIGFKPGA